MLSTFCCRVSCVQDGLQLSKCRDIVALTDQKFGELTFYPVSRTAFVSLVGCAPTEGGVRLGKATLAKIFGKRKVEKGGGRDERYDASARRWEMVDEMKFDDHRNFACAVVAAPV